MLAAVSQTRESRGARLRRRLLQRGSTRVALGLLIVMVLAALLAPWFATHDPFSGSNDALLPPLSPGHWLGTDDLGRDLMSRLMLGASYSFVHVMDRLHATGTKFQLPAGSRLLDTGGFKGQSRDIPMREFYDLLSTTFGVPAQDCINMYGMTELSSQFYDAGNDTVPSVKRGMHWIRSRVVNPLTGAEVPPGQVGVLVHCDLASFNSTTTILTEDMGVAVEGGFLLLGRAQGTQARGCSLAVAEFLGAGAA